jgi:hypothetical protein
LAEDLVVVAEEVEAAAAVVEEVVETLPFFEFVFLATANGNEKE